MNMKAKVTITKVQFPKDSILNNSLIKYDYVDSFQGVIDRVGKINSTDLGKAFFTSSPEWVGKLFDFRNKIVSVFGLKTSGKTSDRQQQLDRFKCEPGEQLGLFKVFSKTDNEVVLGEDDKHLNFRVSLFLSPQKEGDEKQKIIISTTVEINNWFGRLYFMFVRPFHKLIVPSMLRGIVLRIS
jgi:hypothetical protein